ncbi:hypothetical protein ABPG73_012782 [Tetrahymena malaccensis]
MFNYFVICIIIHQVLSQQLIGQYLNGNTYTQEFKNSQWNNNLDFAIYGWFKIYSFPSSFWQVGFHFTCFAPNVWTDKYQYGDRLLTFHTDAHVLENHTYTTYQPAPTPNIWQDTPFSSSDFNQWIFIYLSYGSQQQAQYVYYKFPSREQGQKMLNIIHNPSNYYFIYVGNTVAPYFQLYIQICDQSGSVQVFEPCDIQISSKTLPNLNQSYNQTTQQSFQVKVKKYEIPFNTAFDLQRVKNNLENIDENNTNREENLSDNQQQQQANQNQYLQQNIDSEQQIINRLKVESKIQYQEAPYLTPINTQNMQLIEQSKQKNQEIQNSEDDMQILNLDQQDKISDNFQNQQKNQSQKQSEQQVDFSDQAKQHIKQQDDLSIQSNQLNQQYELQLQKLQNQIGTLETITKIISQPFSTLNIQQNNYYTTQNNIQQGDNRQIYIQNNFQENSNQMQIISQNNQEIQAFQFNDKQLNLDQEEIKIQNKNAENSFDQNLKDETEKGNQTQIQQKQLNDQNGEEASTANSKTLSFLLIVGIDFIGTLTLMSIFKLILAQYSNQGQSATTSQQLVGYYNPGMSPISKTFTNNSWDNLLDFAIYGWFKIQQITNIWGVGFHFTSTPKNVWDDKNKFGDRLLTLFVLGNTLENHTYTLYSQGSQSASPNIWLDTSPQAPIYRYMDLSFQFQLYIQICDQSGSVQLFEPYDIQINSITLPSLSQNYKQTTQQIFSVSVKKYQIPFSTNFDLQNLINTQNNVEVNNSKKDEKSTNRDENIALNQKKQQYLYQQQNFDSIQQINNNLKIEQKHSYELPYITSNINKDIEQQKSSQENNQDALQDDKQLQLIDLDQYIQKENLQQNIDKVQKEQQQNIQPDQKEKLEQQIDSLSSQSNQLQQQYELQLQQLQNQLGTLETTTKLAAQTFLSLNIQQNNYYTTQNNIQLIDHRQGSLISNFQINNNEINQKQQFLKDSQNLQSNNDVLNEQNQQKDKNQIQQKSNLDQSSQKNNQEVQKEDSIYLKVVNDNLLKLSKKLFFSIILVTGVTIITLIHKIKIIGKKISALFLISLLLFYYYVILSIISGQEASQANSQTLSFLLIAGIDFIGILTLMSVLKLSLAQYSNQGQRKNKKDQQQFNEQEGQGKYTGKDTAEQRNLDHEFKAIQDINQDKEDPFKQNQFFQKSESKELKQIQKKQDVDLKQAERTSCQREEESNKCYNKQGNNNYNQTENDHILAQLLFQEINQGPLCQKRNDQQFYEYERQKSTKENQFRNAEVSLTEKEKNFLKKQQQELEMFNKQKEQNKDEFDLVEVNEEFINNIFNKQYPNNQQILDKINKEKQQKNENPALELQRRSQKQILEQQKYQQQQIQKQQLQQKQKQLQQQSLTNYVSPNEKRSNQASQKSDFQNLLKEVEGVQYCNLCGEYQRQSLMESHNNKCRMSYVQCEFCNRQFPRYSISDHTVDCLRKEEFKLLDLYQRTFAQDGLQVNRTHQIFFGSRDYMRQQFNQQTFEQQKEIEKLIVQNQKKIKKSYQNNVSRSEYYADVKYVKDPQSSQAEDCCICFVTFIEKETLGMLPCAHKFHTNCIDSWIKVKKLCPLCKRTF